MDDTVFEPPGRETLRDQIYASLKEAILSGKVRPGEPLRETEVAEQMGVSQSPVREALRYLEREGLVVTVPRKGTTVVELGAADVEEIYTLRQVIESLAARRAAEKATSDDLAKLRALIEEMEQAARAGDIVALVEKDYEFHAQICRMAQHSRLLQVWENAHAQVRAFLSFKDQLLSDLEMIPSSHQPLVEALAAGDGERAEQVMKSHIEEMGRQLLEQLAAREAEEE